jgi:hypothetical protein
MFVYAAASDGGDIIHDFRSGEDLIDLRPLFTGSDAKADQVRLVQAGASTQIWFDADDESTAPGVLLVTLIGVGVDDLNAGNGLVV